jgi:hypothetical protein
MKNVRHLLLSPTFEQRQRLLALHALFANACNEAALAVREHRTWHRVTLHHIAYRGLRDRFPELGSQLACNAIYAVSRACHMVFQSPASPLHLSRLGDGPLPRLVFLPTAPVMLDRHTLTLKQGRASMFTLDGRMRFDLALTPDDERAFNGERLLDVALRQRGQSHELCFAFAGRDEPVPAQQREALRASVLLQDDDRLEPLDQDVGTLRYPGDLEVTLNDKPNMGLGHERDGKRFGEVRA